MNKIRTFSDFVDDVARAPSLAIGGGGLQRKPMAAVRALARSAVEGLHLIDFLGGPDVDALVGTGKVRRLTFAFVGFDAFGLAPNFRKARESGALEIVEWSEATFLAGLEAGGKRLPFLPTRFGLGTGIVDTPTSPFRTFPCPLTGETLLAVPAINPDVAVIHVNAADRAGNAVILSDCFADPLLVRAARRVYLTAERIVEDIRAEQVARATFISRLWVHGVIEAPGGGGFTAVFPDYPIDLPAMLDYQAKATDGAWLAGHLRSPA